MYPPDEGEIFYYGRPYHQWGLENIKNKIGIYFQDFFLFHMSLQENVEVGSIREAEGDEGKENLKKAARLGDLKKILGKMPKGYDTMLKKDVEKTGVLLSGGEQQKVGISRAFYGTKELLIFDEPAAALDPIAEIRQFENIRSAAKEHAAILISHRIGFARLADRIVMMKNGTIVEEGSHQELLDQKGVYYEFTQQAQWYRD